MEGDNAHPNIITVLKMGSSLNWNPNVDIELTWHKLLWANQLCMYL